MSVWRASFELAQERLIYLLLAGLLVASIGGKIEKVANDPAADWATGFVPPFFGIESIAIRSGIAMIVAWFLLSIIVTTCVRMRIRRENQIGPKR